MGDPCVWTVRLLDIRVAEYFAEMKPRQELSAEVAEHLGTDVRHNIYHQLKGGELSMLGSSRFYLHWYDRTLAAKEYGLNQSWGTDIVLDQLHKPMEVLKRLKMGQTRASRQAVHKSDEDKDTDLIPAAKQPKKRRKRSSGDLDCSGHPNAAGSVGPSGKPAGQSAYFNKTIELFGNGVNIAEYAAIQVPMVLTLPHECGVWEHAPPDVGEFHFLEPEVDMVFNPDMENLEDDLGRWANKNLTLLDDLA